MCCGIHNANLQEDYNKVVYGDYHIHIGHLFTAPLKTLSIFARSFVHSLLTSGVPMAQSPHPRNGTHLSCCFANQRQYPSITFLFATSWIR